MDMQSPATTNSKGTVIIGGTESDSHVVSLYLVRLLLEENGYTVINRKCQNSVEALCYGTEHPEPVKAYVICNQNGQALEDLRQLNQFKIPNIPVILGGHYTLGCHNLDDQKRKLRSVGVDHFANNMQCLIRLLDALHASSGMTTEESCYDVA